MSLHCRSVPPSAAGTGSPFAVRPDWSFAVASAWQVAVALDHRSRRSDVLMALKGLLALPVETTTSVLERSLLRGYLLELARGLRAGRRAIPDQHAPVVEAFCGWLEIPAATTSELVKPAHILMIKIRDGDEASLLDIAASARALLDRAGNVTLTVAGLARMLGTNARHVERGFRRRYGRSIASYRRERQAQAGLDAIMRGLPLKRAVDFAGCSESTLRRRRLAVTGRTARGWKGRRPQRLSEGTLEPNGTLADEEPR